MISYTVNIAGTTRTVVVENDGTAEIRESGSSLHVRRLSRGEFSVTSGNNAIRVVAFPAKNVIEVLTGGQSLTATVESEQTRLLRQLQGSSHRTGLRKEIVAPMPALVVRLEVETGQNVKGGQGLLVLEAMKMENEIKAHHDGRVKEILVRPGKIVEKGELLILLE
jgi:pyruvate carboxylase subunit B